MSPIIDGEIVVPAADGTTDFPVLQNELRGKSTEIVLLAFDLLYLNDRDLRKLPAPQSSDDRQAFKAELAYRAPAFSSSLPHGHIHPASRTLRLA